MCFHTLQGVIALLAAIIYVYYNCITSENDYSSPSFYPKAYTSIRNGLYTGYSSLLSVPIHWDSQRTYPLPHSVFAI